MGLILHTEIQKVEVFTDKYLEQMNDRSRPHWSVFEKGDSASITNG